MEESSTSPFWVTEYQQKKKQQITLQKMPTSVLNVTDMKGSGMSIRSEHKTETVFY